MIKTVAELLQTIRNREARVLEAQNVVHPGLIGDMYEGLTSAILEKAIPDPINLNVASGLIENTDGRQSRQIDCMLVEGDGIPIPHTDKKRYPIRDVIAVIEVKKNLHAGELRDACQNLLSVADLIEKKPVPNKMVRDPYRLVTGFELPEPDQLQELSVHHQQVHHTIVCEAMLPIRITLAYDGYKSERALRTGFVNLVNENLYEHGFAPAFLPNLIACGDRSLVKLNGMPYATSRSDKWDFIASYNGNPILLLLELLFTRLTYTRGMPVSVFGEDLTVEALNGLLSGEAVLRNGKIGWLVHQTQMADEGEENAEIGWEPYVVDACEFTILNVLCEKGSIDTTDPDFLSFLQEKGHTLASVVEGLRDKRLATLEAGNRLVLLTDECGCLVLPNGEFRAGENKSGRLERWMAKWMERRDGSHGNDPGSAE